MKTLSKLFTILLFFTLISCSEKEETPQERMIETWKGTTEETKYLTIFVNRESSFCVVKAEVDPIKYNYSELEMLMHIHAEDDNHFYLKTSEEFIDCETYTRDDEYFEFNKHTYEKTSTPANSLPISCVDELKFFGVDE